MRIIITLSLLFLSNSYASVSGRYDWIRYGCTLHGKDGSKKSFPGAMCLFLDDGSFISASSDFLRKFSPTKEILWEVPGKFHHQINLSHDKKKILALVSDEITIKDKKVRQDVIYVIDQGGKVLAKKSAEDLLKMKGIEHIDPKEQVFMAKEEISHFNSIYEVPTNARENELSWLRPGNLIINSLYLGIFVLGPDLETIHQHLRFPKGPKGHWVHDVQVTPEGFLLFFKNFAWDGSNTMYSAIQKVDPKKKKVVYEFSAKPKEMFFSEVGGGVQELGENLFFNSALSGAYLYSTKTGKVLESHHHKSSERCAQWIQDIRKVDITEFLKNFKSEFSSPSEKERTLPPPSSGL